MYITPNELNISDELRTRLTDDEDVMIEDIDSIQAAIDEAGAEINSYIGGRVDLATVIEPYSAILKKYCRDIAIYDLWGMIPMISIPDQVVTRYNQAILFLEKYAADGIGSLGIEPTPETGHGDPVGSFPEDEFDLRGY